MFNNAFHQLAYVPARFPADPFGTVCGLLSGRPLLGRKAQKKLFGTEAWPVLYGKQGYDRNFSKSIVLDHIR
jgi:hypothetical protein